MLLCGKPLALLIALGARPLNFASHRGRRLFVAQRAMFLHQFAHERVHDRRARRRSVNIAAKRLALLDWLFTASTGLFARQRLYLPTTFSARMRIVHHNARTLAHIKHLFAAQIARPVVQQWRLTAIVWRHHAMRAHLLEQRTRVFCVARCRWLAVGEQTRALLQICFANCGVKCALFGIDVAKAQVTRHCD